MNGQVAGRHDDGRPAAETLLRAMFAPEVEEPGGVWVQRRHRLRPEARRHLVAELRCPRKRHLVAVVVRTPWGPWGAWWEWHLGAGGRAGMPATPLGPTRWECAWVDGTSIYNAQCTCRVRNRLGPAYKRWIVPLYWLADQRGVVLARMR